MEITLDQLDDLSDPFLVDVRSPGEYREDHLPGAVNLPVLDDDQRDRVGTIYHQESTFKARREGAKLICANAPDIIDTIDKHASQERPVVLYCWRGGQRSQSLSLILDRIGYNVHRLEGGYKSYRKRVHDYLREGRWDSPIVTLFGYTGSGKTRVLEQLNDQGESILDLEAAANHRGSAFGGVGLGDQPTQKSFERDLYEQLRHAPAPIYSEGESRKIGGRIIPDELFDRVVESPRVWLEVPREVRVENISRDYPWREHREELTEKLTNLTERLGSDRVDSLRSQLRDGNVESVVDTLLTEYYDPAYEKSCPDPDSFDHRISATSPGEATKDLLTVAEFSRATPPANH